MSGRDWERRKAGGDGGSHEETAEPTAHPMIQLHSNPAIARSLYQRHVQRRAAANAAGGPEQAPDLLAADGAGPDAGTATPAIQRKKKDPDANTQAHTAPTAEAPTAGQVGSATIHALQSHMKLTSMRMYAVAANMHTIMGSSSNTDAGVEPIIQALQQQYDIVMNDLGQLSAEVARVPDLMRGAMSEELGMLRGAWYDNNGLNRAMSSVYSFTHDKDGRPRADATSFTGSITDVQNQLKGIYTALHVDEGDITNRYLPRGADVVSSLGQATTEAFDSGIDAIQVCTRRLKADLDSMDDKDADGTAADLLAAVTETAASSKAIDAKNMGAVKRVVQDVEALQAELAKRSGPKIAKLARLIGYNSNVSVNLHALHQRIDQVAKEKPHH